MTVVGELRKIVTNIGRIADALEALVAILLETPPTKARDIVALEDLQPFGSQPIGLQHGKYRVAEPPR